MASLSIDKSSLCIRRKEVGKCVASVETDACRARTGQRPGGPWSHTVGFHKYSRDIFLCSQTKHGYIDIADILFSCLHPVSP
jgi:hypothetical protein